MGQRSLLSGRRLVKGGLHHLFLFVSAHLAGSSDPGTLFQAGMWEPPAILKSIRFLMVSDTVPRIGVPGTQDPTDAVSSRFPRARWSNNWSVIFPLTGNIIQTAGCVCQSFDGSFRLGRTISLRQDLHRSQLCHPMRQKPRGQYSWLPVDGEHARANQVRFLYSRPACGSS